MANPTNNNEPPNADTQMNSKRRRKKSIVWEHFTIETIDAGCTRACCKQCKRSFAYISGSKVAGTSHLKRHIALGICPVSRLNQENGQVLSRALASSGNGAQNVSLPPRKRRRNSSGPASFSFDQDRCRQDIAKMIIMHGYPLDIVESPGFVDSVRALQPQFIAVTANAIERDCVEVFRREKQAVLNLISSIPGRVNLSLDVWYSDQSVGYAFITGQFIDNDWKLHRRILAVVLLPFLDSESAFGHALVSCIADWNLDNKLFTLTLDESFANKAVRRNLRGLLSMKNPLVLNGELMLGSCYARVLSHLAQDALGSMSETVKKVRDSVKYVVTAGGYRERFNDLKQQLQVPSTKTLVLDDSTKWNTTYHMLVAACELKEVFSCLDASDPNYRVTPSMNEWKQTEILCMFLKLLFDAANLLTGPAYPTANAFFHEAWNIQLELKHAATSGDEFVRNLTRPMHERFNKYWNDYFLVFSIAVVMDPRFKMKLVEFSFSRIYGDDADRWIKAVDDGVHELFLDYIVQMLPPPTFVVNGNGNGNLLKTDTPQEETFLHYEILNTEKPQDDVYLQTHVPKEEILQDDLLSSSDDGLSDFDVYISGIASHHNLKPELDQYLEESVLPRMQEFDVLGWWKLNWKKYPTLSKLALDILCVPVSTVSKDSAFDLTRKKMDRYRCSLRPSTLEALVCAKDWLGSSENSSPVSSESVMTMEL